MRFAFQPGLARNRLALRFGLDFIAGGARFLVGQQFQLQTGQCFAVRPQDADSLLPQPLFEHLNFQMGPPAPSRAITTDRTGWTTAFPKALSRRRLRRYRLARRESRPTHGCASSRRCARRSPTPVPCSRALRSSSNSVVLPHHHLHRFGILRTHFDRIHELGTCMRLIWSTR
jgi:hypothetical protein